MQPKKMQPKKMQPKKCSRKKCSRKNAAEKNSQEEIRYEKYVPGQPAGTAEQVPEFFRIVSGGGTFLLSPVQSQSVKPK